jgi:predicted ATP-dependent serine protease
VEVQAGVSLVGPGGRGRMTAPNLPKREVEQLVECLGRMEGFDLDDLSFRISARLPGRNRYGSSAGMALAMALLGSYLQKPIPRTHVYLGEVDLARAICPLEDMLLNQLVNELTSGDELFGPYRFFAHPLTIRALPRLMKMEFVPCERLEQAMFATWPSLR